MPKKLEFKFCRVCNAKVYGRPRHTRKAFWYPRQCDKCFRLPQDEKHAQAAISGRQKGLKKSWKLNQKAIGSTQFRTCNSFVYCRIKISPLVWRDEHRYVIEQMLHRKLKRSEHVHHLNGNTLDNRIENLVVVSAKEHKQYHRLSQWAKNYVACVCCGTKTKKHIGFGLCSTCGQRKKCG